MGVFFIACARYCALCLCSRPGCSAPRHHGEYCKADAAAIGELSSVWKLVHACRRTLPAMIPADIRGFAQHFGELQQDLPIAILAAKGKDSAFIESLLESWRSQPVGYTAETLGAWIRRALAAAAEAKLALKGSAEAAQIAVKSEGRSHLGPRAVGADFGIIRKRPAGTMAFNGSGPGFEFTEQPEGMVSFLEACRRHSKVFGGGRDLRNTLQDASLALVDIGKACPNLFCSAPTSSVHKAILRKFAIGCISTGSAVDWAKWHVADLAAFCPDAGEHLKTLGHDLPVDAASGLILGRPDHGLLLAMWACLFSQAGPAQDPDAAVAFLLANSEAICEQWLQDHGGAAPRPVDLCEQIPKRRKTNIAERSQGTYARTHSTDLRSKARE